MKCQRDAVVKWKNRTAFLKNRDQLLTNKSPVKENNWYNSTTSRMLIYQQLPHIHEAKNMPSSGNNLILILSGLKSLDFSPLFLFAL
jgi:hypothetical protein